MDRTTTYSCMLIANVDAVGACCSACRGQQQVYVLQVADLSARHWGMRLGSWFKIVLLRTEHPSRLACDMDGMAAAHAAIASRDALYDWMLLVHV